RGQGRGACRCRGRARAVAFSRRGRARERAADAPAPPRCRLAVCRARRGRNQRDDLPRPLPIVNFQDYLHALDAYRGFNPDGWVAIYRYLPVWLGLVLILLGAVLVPFGGSERTF